MKQKPESITLDELQNAYVDKMFAGIEKKIIDETALSLGEISEWLKLKGHSRASVLAHTKTETGEWQQVWKHHDRILVKAYRAKK